MNWIKWTNPILQPEKAFLLAGLMGALLIPPGLWAAPATPRKAADGDISPAASAAVASECHHGWRRVGTLKDFTLGRAWAVVASCRHPAWPAHLELSTRWKPLPRRIPAGSRVEVISPLEGTEMHLEGWTIVPGRVGQPVTVRLMDGARVLVRLIAPGKAVMAMAARWRHP